MLENRTIIIRPEKHKKRIQLYFILSSAILGFVLILLIPELFGIGGNKEDFSIFSIGYFKKIIGRGIYGLIAGVIFSLFVSKNLSSRMMVQLIRIFLITFIFLSAFTFIALK